MGKVRKNYKKPNCKSISIGASVMNTTSPIIDDDTQSNAKDDDEVSLWSFLLPLLMVAATLLSACGETEFIYIKEGSTDSTHQTTVYLNMPEYELTDNDATRGIEYVIDSKVHVYWSNDVTIGVFPVAPQVNSQVKYTFTVPQHDASFKTRFVGVGWGLKANNTYAAYYPYQSLSSDLQYNAIPISMLGQTQTGNTNMDGFGKYECLYAKATMPVDSTVTFNFSRKNAIIWLRLVMDTYGNWNNVTLTNTNGDSVFIEEATMDVATGEITPVKRSPSISLGLKNVYSNVGDTLNLFISTLPTQTGQLLISLHSDGSDAKEVFAMTNDNELISNHIRRITRTPTKDQHLFVDLGLPSGTQWARCNLGALQTYDHGQYYAWGEPASFTDYFYWTRYTYCIAEDEDGHTYWGNSSAILSKYTIPDEFYTGIWYDKSRNFIGDNLREIELINDPAHFSWGGDWRVPSKEQFQELFDNCTSQWTDNYNGKGVAGYVFTAKNGNSIFLPASGWIGCENERDIPQFEANNKAQTPGKPHQVYDDPTRILYYHWEDAYGYNSGGYYWTRNLSDEYSFDAIECKFAAFDVKDSTLHAQPSLTPAKRYLGCTIRPVKVSK